MTLISATEKEPRYTISGEYIQGGGAYLKASLNSREVALDIQEILEAGEILPLSLTISIFEE